jgi:hypothetical protein
MRSMPSSPSPENSGGSVGGGVPPPPPRPAETVVLTALRESVTVPIEVICVPKRSGYREFAFSATTDGNTLRFTRNNSSVRFMDPSRRPSGILGGVDPANRRIPALRAR